MRRRDFGKGIAGGLLSTGIARAATALIADGHAQKTAITPRKNTMMHVGADYHVAEGGGVMSREHLEYNLRFGVRHISPDPEMILEGEAGVRRPLASPDSRGGAFISAEGPSGGAFDLDKLKRMRDACDAVGMTIEGFRMDSGYIVMKPGPERDRKIEQILGNIRKTHQVGVGLISQHWTMIPIRRNGKEPGRGGATYETFKLEDNWRSLPAGIAGTVSKEAYWDRITFFLQKVIPVCAE